MIFASHRMWNGLLENGLLDELHLMVSPVALGRGVPLFTGSASVGPAGRAPRPENSANVQLRYRPRRYHADYQAGGGMVR